MSPTSRDTIGPFHEVLFSKDKDFTREYNDSFAGMTREPVNLSTLVEARALLREELLRRLTPRHKQLLIGLTRAATRLEAISISSCRPTTRFAMETSESRNISQAKGRGL